MKDKFQPRDLTHEMDRADHVEEGEIIQLVGMKLGEEEYAIDVLKIQEIIRTVEITTVPRTDGFVLGVMNLRGKVIPVIDLRVRFHLDKTDFDKATRIIVVRFEKENIGFVVDEVTEVIRINKNMVDPTPPLVGSIGQEYILGICKYDDRLIILLDIDRVISEGTAGTESDLRRRFLGTTAEPSKQPYDIPELRPAQKAPSFDEDDEISFEKPAAPAPKKAAPAAPAPVAEESDDIQFDFGDEDMGNMFAEEGDADSDAEQSIDDLIAMELAKREAETDAAHAVKKKK